MNSLSTIPGFMMNLASACDVTWSIATFGAIAEYSHAPGEDVLVKTSTAPHSEGFSIISPRGALQYRHSPNVRVIAYEGLSKNPGLWSQGISICLPEQDAQSRGLRVLTEIPPEHDALMDSRNGHLMFDIGLGAPHIDACIRTQDEALAATLRVHTGKRLYDGAAEALHAILAHSPDRVFISTLGRIEVSTPIAHENGETETGPHTHVLPDLLEHDRTHAANVPIPVGHLPCLNIFPPNPARDIRGEPRIFSNQDHAVFQDILATYGDPTANAIKKQVMTIVAAGGSPGSLIVPENGLSRIERTALRVTLRQIKLTSGDSPVLDNWLSVFEPNTDQA